MKPKTEHKTNLEQLRALSSEVRLRLLHFFTEGEYSEADVAERLGVAPQSLYYHIRIMLQTGLIVQSGIRRTAKKPQALYRAVAESIVPSPDISVPAEREAFVKSIKAMLRIASREVEWAVEAGKYGPGDYCFFTRQRLQLTPENAKRFREELDALTDAYAAKEAGSLTVCFTAVAAPRQVR